MFRFKCATCDKWHEGQPSVAFAEPDYVLDVPERERKARVRTSDDLCSVDDEFFFARVCLEIPIIDAGEPFH
jgi:hypothetical protein